MPGEEARASTRRARAIRGVRRELHDAASITDWRHDDGDIHRIRHSWSRSAEGLRRRGVRCRRAAVWRAACVERGGAARLGAVEFADCSSASSHARVRVLQSGAVQGRTEIPGPSSTANAAANCVTRTPGRRRGARSLHARPAEEVSRESATIQDDSRQNRAAEAATLRAHLPVRPRWLRFSSVRPAAR